MKKKLNLCVRLDFMQYRCRVCQSDEPIHFESTNVLSLHFVRGD